MKIVSWNVNGLRAVLNKGFLNFFNSVNADIFCIQETKMHKLQGDFQFPGFYEYWNEAEKKGYSGTLILTKKKPISYSLGIQIEEHDKEGRVITLEYDEFFIVNCYTPNSKRELERLEYRQRWEDDFRNYIKKLDNKKPVILCGDLNVAHKEIDLKNPKANKKNAGFTEEERNKMTELLNNGFIDTYRYLYPNTENAYTWWSYMGKAREKNIGWRIDYFIISKILSDKILENTIHSNILGSDHCPIELNLEIDN